MTTDTEALRARFEKLLSDSGRACLYEGDGQYAYPHDFSWLCYQAGYAAAKAETAAAVAAERERCLRIVESVDNYSNPMTANDCADAIRAGAKSDG